MLYFPSQIQRNIVLCYARVVGGEEDNSDDDFGTKYEEEEKV